MDHYDKGKAALTDADREDIRNGVLKRGSYDTERRVRDRTRQVAFELADFLHEGYLDPSHYAKWLVAVAEAVSEDHFIMIRWEAKTKRRSYRVDDVFDIIEENAEESREDEEWYRKDKGQPPMTEHPWGEENLRVLRALKDVTPYRLWKIQEAVEECAFDTVRDNSLDMVRREDDGKSVAETAERKFLEEIKTLRKELLQD